MPHDMCDVMTLLVTDDWGTVHMQTAHIWLGWSHACALCKQPGIGSLATCEGHGGRRADRCGHDQCHICTHDTSYLMPYVPYTTALTEDVFTKMVLHNIAQALTVEEIFQIVRLNGHRRQFGTLNSGFLQGSEQFQNNNNGVTAKTHLYTIPKLWEVAQTWKSHISDGLEKP